MADGQDAWVLAPALPWTCSVTLGRPLSLLGSDSAAKREGWPGSSPRPFCADTVVTVQGNKTLHSLLLGHCTACRVLVLPSDSYNSPKGDCQGRQCHQFRLQIQCSLQTLQVSRASGHVVRMFPETVAETGLVRRWVEADRERALTHSSLVPLHARSPSSSGR